MAKYSNVVEYNIVTDVDSSGIVKLQNELTKLKQSLKFDKTGFSQLGFDDAKIDKSIRKVNQLQSALTAAFNPKIGTLDLSKLNASLQKEHTSLQMIVKDWEQMGTRGTMAISNLSNALLSMNKSSMNVNTTLSKIANTFSNTVRWGITASIFQEMMSSVQGAVSYMKNLDESLTQIQMVTNSSKENMRELAQYANNAAQALGSTTVDYTNAVKVFVQEGFSESESKQYANLSTKLANVSEQSTAVTSDQITAFRNAFQLDYEQTVAAMDKVANVANNTASNVNELMTASQRAASVAQAVGASQDSFLASIATIESVTRQSAEEIGNGLKTIYQRFADIKVSGSTEDGVDYGQYAKALKQIGVDVLDAQGEFKGMDQILKETQEVWSGLSETMKVAVGEKVAGKFQYNRFAALMNNPEYYQKALGATQGAEGMMDQMNEYYMDSIEGRLKTLQAAGEQVMSTLFNQDAVEPIIEDVTHLVNGLNDMVDAAGGLSGVFTGLSAIMLRTFSTQIAGTISNMASSLGTIIANSRNAKQLQTATALFGLDKLDQGMDGSKTGKLLNNVANNYDQLSVSTQEKVRDLSQQIVDVEEQKNNLLRQQEKFMDDINGQVKEELMLSGEKLQTIDDQIALIKAEAEDTGVLTKKQEKQLEILERQIGPLEKNIQIYDRITKECTEYINQIANGEKLTAEQVEQVQRWRAEADNVSISITKLNQLVEQLGIAENNINMGDALIDDITTMTQLEASMNSLIKGLAGLSSVAFGVTMLGDAIKTLSDDSASVEEKVNAVIMDGLMGLTMLIPGIVELTKVKWAEIAASGAGIIKTLAYNVALAAETLASKAAAAGAWELSAALMGVNAALMATPVGWVVAAIAVITAIIAGCVIAYDSWQNSIHAASKEFETQQELLSKTKKNYSEIKDEVDSLKQSLDSIGQTKDSLSDLTKGTDEWREAVRKLNDEVLTLLQTYPELAQYVKNQEGVLTIDDVGMNQFYQQKLNEANHLASVNSVQQINTLEAQNKKYVEDFSNQWGLSKEEISSAIERGAYSLEGKSDILNSAFVELTNKVQANSAAIDNLSDSVGTLNTTYVDYSSDEIDDLSTIKESIKEQYGVHQRDEYGNDLGTVVDFSKMTNNQDFIDAIAQATGKNIVGATDTSWFDSNVKFKTNTGDEFEYTTDQLLNLLADSQIAIDATNKKLEENKIIYEAFGASYDKVNNKFVNSSGETISSLENLKDITKDQIAAIEAFQDGIYNNIATEDFEGSLEEFIHYIQESSDSVKGFSEALLAEKVWQKQGSIFGSEGKLTSLAQTQGVMARFDDGTVRNMKLTPEQAKDIMADMMKQLNESSLSKEEKLQLMDKINWDMPVEDIIANIQHAIDTGNIESAFMDNSGIEDDSDREEEVLKKYSIDESTLDTYKEQLQTTGALGEEYQKLVNKVESAKIWGKESEAVKDAKEELAAFGEESRDIALDLAQTQKGLEALSNNMAKYSDILKKGDKTTLEYAEALSAVKSSLADTLNVSAENLSNAMVEQNLADIEALAAGDEEALNRLRAAAGQDIVAGFYIAEDSNLTWDHLDYLQQKALEIASLDIEVGAAVNDEQFINTLNEMMASGELTKDQVNEYLHSIGVEPHMETENIPTQIFSTKGMFVEIPMPFGAPPAHINVPEFTVYGNVGVPKITAGASKNGSSGAPALRRTASPTAPSGKTGINPSYVNDAYKPKSGSGKSPSGGGGKQAKNNQKKDKETSQWDYLTDITNDLDRAAAAMEKLAKLEDRLYGANRISQLKKLRTEYKNYIKLLQQEVKLAESHAETLRTNAKDENGNLTINGYAYRAGINQLKFDAQNNLENGREIEQALLSRVNNAIATYNQHRNDEDTGKYEWDLNQAKSDYDGFLKAMSEYENTLGKIEDSQSAIQDYKEKIQDAADEIVDAIQQGIEDMIETIDNQRNFNKLYRDWMQGGNSYSHFDNDRRYYAEGLQGLLSSNPYLNGKSLFNVQIQNLSDRIADIKDIFDKDSSNADDEKLSEQAAFENLQEATTNIMDSLNKMIDYYDSLLSTIEEASSKMDELIDGRLEEFDKLENYLDTRLDQLKLIFGDKSYEQQTQFYNQKIATNMEKMVSINTALEAKQVTVKTLEKLEETGKQLSTEERKELQNARDKVNELQEEQLNTETKLLQDIADKLRAQTSAEMTNLVNELFGGNDVEWLSQQWEIATRNSEKYYDDYNRAFELQKLQLKFQKALNDNQNSSLAAQQKINDLANEYLTYLREKNKLSEYDVKHAQLQLDILQKQIALEDARNNKSQMRLQRNAAGNYDFVYAADENAVNQATEALLAAQQEAYNLSKQMYLQTYEAAYEAALQTRDMVVEIATDASLSVEERSERIKEILDGLNEYLSGSSVELSEISINLYNSFVDAETMVLEENQGNLSAIFEQIKIESEALHDELKNSVNATTINIEDSINTSATNIGNTVNTTASNIQNKIDEVVQDFGDKTTDLQTTMSSAFGTISTNGIGSFNTLETRITGQGGILEKIKVGSIDTSNGINAHINNIIEQIDQRFALSGDNILLKITDIDIKVYDAIQKIIGSNGYLEDFEYSTEQALSVAGDSYKRFTEESIDYSAEQLEELRDITNYWRSDLISLNAIISNSTKEMMTWRDKITMAMNEARDFIQTANELQLQLEGNSIMASVASSAFDYLSSSANMLESSVQSMANTLENSYYSIAGAAETAASAYSDMASAAYEAGNAAQWAANELANLSWYDPTYFDVSGAVNQVRSAIGSTASAIANTVARNFKAKSSSINPLSKSAWGGAGFATGGYTGIWSDKGVDSKNGKLAILHQKELVLNAEDTKNMLSAVEVVRDIMSGINTLPSIGKTLNQNVPNNDIIEQRVEINATFPGVTEAIEIKQALEQIADNAYQVANKYKY